MGMVLPNGQMSNVSKLLFLLWLVLVFVADEIKLDGTSIIPMVANQLLSFINIGFPPTASDKMAHLALTIKAAEICSALNVVWVVLVSIDVSVDDKEEEEE